LHFTLGLNTLPIFPPDIFHEDFYKKLLSNFIIIKNDIIFYNSGKSGLIALFVQIDALECSR
jgi:hypothetical protein